MAKLTVQLEAKARKATKRPKSVVAKTLTTAGGAKLRVTSLDANSASFGADFLYVFKNNVRRARKDAAAKGKPVVGPKLAR
jgi:uncharacterized protein YbbK (DUF523 family)